MAFVLRRGEEAYAVPRHPEQLTIGRSKKSGIVVGDSSKVSGKHVAVSAVGESVVLTNFSGNGVYIKGDGRRFSETRTPRHLPRGGSFSLLHPKAFAGYSFVVDAASPSPAAAAGASASPTSAAAIEDPEFADPKVEPYEELDDVSRHLFLASRPASDAEEREMAAWHAAEAPPVPPPAAAKDEAPAMSAAAAGPSKRQRSEAPAAAAPAAAATRPSKRTCVLSPCKGHVIERVDGNYSDEETTFRTTAAPARSPRTARGEERRTASLTVLNWNLGSENRGGKWFQMRAVQQVARVVNEAWAAAQARPAGALVVAFQELPIDCLVEPKFRFHRLLALGLDSDLRWVEPERFDAPSRGGFHGRGLLVSRGVTVVEHGEAAVDGQSVDADGVAHGGSTIPYVVAKLRGADTDRAATVVVGSAHVRCGDLVMRESARKWLRDRGASGDYDASILCGDFNEDLRDMARDKNDWRRTNLRVLWPKGGIDTKGWRWGSYHGYHNGKKIWTNKGRIIDGAVCFGTHAKSNVSVDGAELLGVPPEAADVDADDHDKLEECLLNAPADHFPVATHLAVSFLAKPPSRPVDDLDDSDSSEWPGRSLASSAPPPPAKEASA